MKVNFDFLNKIPRKQKILMAVLVFLGAGYAYYFFFFQPLYETRSALALQLDALDQQIAAKQMVVNEIQKGKREINVLKSNLEIALTKLPDQKEIPSLLASISESGRELGLEFLLFEPISPVQKEYYMEIPAKIAVIGNFHNVVQFFEKIARLSRIVNITDISMVDAKSKGNNMLLNTTCTIQTYMFNEKAAPSEKATDKKKK